MRVYQWVAGAILTVLCAGCLGYITGHRVAERRAKAELAGCNAAVDRGIALTEHLLERECEPDTYKVQCSEDNIAGMRCAYACPEPAEPGAECIPCCWMNEETGDYQLWPPAEAGA